MAPPLKIFGLEKIEDAVIVIPIGEGSAFRYQDLQAEANTIRMMFGRGQAKHLVIDLHKMDYFGSEFIGALVSMAREVKNRGGKATMCSATPQMLEVLKNMSLFKLWPYFETRDEAVASVHAA